MKKYLCIIIGGFVLSMFAVPAMAISLTSPAFKNGQSMPAIYAHQSAKSPELVIHGLKNDETTKKYSVSIVVNDIDYMDKVHWSTKAPVSSLVWKDNDLVIPEDFSAKETKQSVNERYVGPFPPAGDSHHYVFTVTIYDGDKAVDSAEITGVFE